MLSNQDRISTAERFTFNENTAKLDNVATHARYENQSF